MDYIHALIFLEEGLCACVVGIGGFCFPGSVECLIR